MTIHAIELLALLAYVVLRESRLAQLRGAGKALAQQALDYTAHLSRASMAGRTREEWLANDATRIQRQDFVAALSRFYELSGNQLAKAEIGQFVPSMNDSQQWSSAAALEAGARREMAKYVP